MYKKTLAVAGVLATLVGCGTTPPNPVNYVTYRDEPLVKQVETGMTRSQALTLGGAPSSEVQRTVKPGACNNYVLNKEGREQTYYVSFNAAGIVDGKGFLTCQQMEANERALK